MIEQHGAVFGGFAIMQGEFKINSWTFNAPKDSEFHDNMRNLGPDEIKLLTGAAMIYSASGFPDGF